MAEVAWFENALGALVPPRRHTCPECDRHDSFPAASHPYSFRHPSGHLAARPSALADFLAHNDCATLFLVGDIVDGWAVEAPLALDRKPKQVVAEILRKVMAAPG